MRKPIAVLIVVVCGLLTACRSSQIMTISMDVPATATLTHVTVIQTVYSSEFKAALTKEVPFDLFRGAKTAVGTNSSAGDRP